MGRTVQPVTIMPLIVPVAPMPAAPAPEPSAAATPASPGESTPRFADALSRAGQSASASPSKGEGASGKPEAAQPDAGSSAGAKPVRGKDSTPPQGQDPAAATPTAAALAVQASGVLEAAMAAAPSGKTLPQDAPKTDVASTAPTPPGVMLAVMLQAPVTQATPATATPAHDAGALPATANIALRPDDAPSVATVALGLQGGRSHSADGAAPGSQTLMPMQASSQVEVSQRSSYAMLQRAVATGGELTTLTTPSPSHGDAATSASAQPGVIGQTPPLGLPQTNPAATAQWVSTVPTPMNSPDWGKAMNQQVLLAAQGQQQFATLHLNPPQLGPLEVHLQMHDGQIQAQFVSQHAVVRQAVESALPQLRDLFTGAGLTLSQTSVGAQGGQGDRQQARSQRGPAATIGTASVTGALGATATQPLRWQQGLVNTYV